MTTPRWLETLESTPVPRWEFERLRNQIARVEKGEAPLEPWPDLGKEFPQTERYKRVAADLAAEFERGPAGQEGQLYIRSVENGFVDFTPDGLRIFTGWASAGIMTRALNLEIWQWVKQANEDEAERMTRPT